MIDKKITEYTLLISLAIASTPIPVLAMEDTEQLEERLRRGSNSSSESNSSDSDSTVYGSRDRSDESPIPAPRPRPRPSVFAAMEAANHHSAHHHSGSLHPAHHKPKPLPLRPDKKVSGGRYPIPICRGVMVCGVIAFVVALTQMYTRKQQKAKKDKNNPQAKKSNCATFYDENTLHA